MLDDKMQILADWLETSDLDAETIILDIEDEGGGEFWYEGENYLVLSNSEVNQRLDDYSDDIINDVQYELDRSDYSYAHYLMVDADAIRADESIEQIGEEYSEFNGYYIFTK